MGRSFPAPAQPSTALPACGTAEENKTTLLLLLLASDIQVFALPEVFIGSGAGVKPQCRELGAVGALGGLLSWLDAVPGAGRGGFGVVGLVAEPLPRAGSLEKPFRAKSLLLPGRKGK